MCHNNSQVLVKDYATCGTIFINYVSNFVFHFIQTSTEGSQTAEGKHKFETFAKSYGINILYYHAKNKIFNN